MLLNLITDMELYWHRAFVRELKDFPLETQENMLALIRKFANGEKLPPVNFKTFRIDKKIKIQEFRIKDFNGNWRAISVMLQKNRLVLLYAFHKKTQILTPKDKEVIRARLRGYEND